MKESTYTRVYSARTASEADEIIGRLRNAGLHPVDVSLSAPLPLPDSEPTFPIEVPAEEADAALELLKASNKYV